MSKSGEKVHDKKVFRPYDQNQLMIPMNADFLIPKNHIVRVVNGAIDKMNLEPLLAKYPGGGRSSFNPVMMTKLIVYASQPLKLNDFHIIIPIFILYIKANGLKPFGFKPFYGVSFVTAPIKLFIFSYCEFIHQYGSSNTSI